MKVRQEELKSLLMKVKESEKVGFFNISITCTIRNGIPDPIPTYLTTIFSLTRYPADL